MPALPVIPQTFRCALDWSAPASGQSAENVIHFGADSTGKTAAQVFATLDAHVTAALWNVCSTAASVVSVSITPLDGSSATQTFPTASPAKWTGGNGGDFSPASSAVVKFQTAYRGRSKRGRIFLPFIAESAMAGGFITSGSAAGLTTAWTALQAALIADATTPGELFVASYKLGTASPITRFFGEQALGTQRRRQGRLR